MGACGRPGRRSRGVGVPPPGAGSGIRRRAGGGAGVGRGGRAGGRAGGASWGRASSELRGPSVRPPARRHCWSRRVSGLQRREGAGRAAAESVLRGAERPALHDSRGGGRGAGRARIAGLSTRPAKGFGPQPWRFRSQHSPETAGTQAPLPDRGNAGCCGRKP